MRNFLQSLNLFPAHRFQPDVESKLAHHWFREQADGSGWNFLAWFSFLEIVEYGQLWYQVEEKSTCSRLLLKGPQGFLSEFWYHSGYQNQLREERWVNNHDLLFKQQVTLSRKSVLNLSGPAGLRWVITLPLDTTWQSPRNQQVEALGFFSFLLLFSFSTLPASSGLLWRREGEKVPQEVWDTAMIVTTRQALMSYIETPLLI